MRRLQQSNNTALTRSGYSTLKTIDNTNSSIVLSRYAPIENPNAINNIRTFFQIISRLIIYLGLALFFLGLQTILTHFMHNLQKIWLHIFIAAMTAPALLRQALTGFRETQNQNIAINPTKW